MRHARWASVCQDTARRCVRRLRNSRDRGPRPLYQIETGLWSSTAPRLSMIQTEIAPGTIETCARRNGLWLSQGSAFYSRIAGFRLPSSKREIRVRPSDLCRLLLRKAGGKVGLGLTYRPRWTAQSWRGFIPRVAEFRLFSQTVNIGLTAVTASFKCATEKSRKPQRANINFR